ncbi:hypothetical protein [Streptomyces sp. ICBB 8177]|uniref:Rv1733c family protein n=1 Tax=Streptomyces sp. ICBB 8177 TaxID=563922 RepID=UPI000D67FDEE|nr:hypothetical protein [Streptomyces sp. ICBB 8177]PWI45711.1 hypothetical protein CK485_00595 [Streptomyces sp. ICBB 8177]
MRSTTRLWRWRRSPLRRASDVVEAWTLLLALALAAVLAPLTGVVVTHADYASEARQGREYHRTTAVLAATAPRQVVDATTGQRLGQVPAPARWQGPGGVTHVAYAEVQPGTKAGTRTTLWTDAHGRVGSAPLSGGASQAQADLIGGSLGCVVVAGLLGGHRIAVRVTLDRRRARQWEAAWAEVEPRWTHGRA